jgi:hypothetical protein
MTEAKLGYTRLFNARKAMKKGRLGKAWYGKGIAEARLG